MVGSRARHRKCVAFGIGATKSKTCCKGVNRHKGKRSDITHLFVPWVGLKTVACTAGVLQTRTKPSKNTKNWSARFCYAKGGSMNFHWWDPLPMRLEPEIYEHSAAGFRCGPRPSRFPLSGPVFLRVRNSKSKRLCVWICAGFAWA